LNQTTLKQKNKMKITFKYHYQYKDYQFEIETSGYRFTKEVIRIKYNSIEEHINDLNRFIKADGQSIEVEDQTAFTNVYVENEKEYVQNIKYYELMLISGDKELLFLFNKRKLYMKNYMTEYRKNNPEKIKEIKAKSYLKSKTK